MTSEFFPESLEMALRIKAHAEARGMTAAQFAFAGPRTEEQLNDYLGAVDLELNADDEVLIDGIVNPGHPSTPGYSDPAYPIEGRVVTEVVPENRTVV